MKSSVIGLLLGLCYLSSWSQNQKPNIIYIMSDDHDDDAISIYRKLNAPAANPLIQTPNIDRVGKEGMVFRNAFVSNSICSPARATVLSGKFSHLNGVKDNITPFDTSQYTFIKQLRANGYQTAIIGKWHLHIRPSGFDHFSILPGQGAYYSPRFINKKDTSSFKQGYITEEITRQTLDWLDHRDQKKPFVVMMHHKAPHRSWMPALKYLEVFSKKKFPEPPTLFVDASTKGRAFRDQQMTILNDMELCTDLKVDPGYLRDLPGFSVSAAEAKGYEHMMAQIPEPVRRRMQEIYAERGKILQSQKPTGKQLLSLKYQWYMQDYLACIASVDESVGQLLDYLERNHLAENTVVFYTSDQGFYLGENGWFDKRFMYDVSMKTPLLVRWPAHVQPNQNKVLVQNIDLAPTFLDLAGMAVPDEVQGLSLKPILLGESKTLSRNSLYYRYYEFPDPHHVYPHLGIRNDRYKLIFFYTVNEWEFYDLEKDPDEQSNQILNPAYTKKIEAMKQELVRLKKHYKDSENAGELE